MEFTTNLNLPKPADGEDGWGDEMRTAMDTLDDRVGAGTSATDRLYVQHGGDIALTSGSYVAPNLLTADAGFHDPSAWIQDGDYESTYWSATYGAGTWALLPAGLYSVNAQAIFDTSVTGGRQIDAPYVIDNRMTVPGWDDIQGDPMFTFVPVMTVFTAADLPKEQSTGNVVLERAGTFQITEAMASAGPVATVLFEVFQNSGSPVTLDGYCLWLVRFA